MNSEWFVYRTANIDGGAEPELVGRYPTRQEAEQKMQEGADQDLDEVWRYYVHELIDH